MNGLKHTTKELEVYIQHEGTLRISGATSPHSAAAHGVARYDQDKVVELVCIGANANHQASKAMGVLRDSILTKAGVGKVEVAFIPLRYKTVTVSEGKPHEKDCNVWRMVVIQCEDQ